MSFSPSDVASNLVAGRLVLWVLIFGLSERRLVGSLGEGAPFTCFHVSLRTILNCVHICPFLSFVLVVFIFFGKWEAFAMGPSIFLKPPPNLKDTKNTFDIEIKMGNNKNLSVIHKTSPFSGTEAKYPGGKTMGKMQLCTSSVNTVHTAQGPSSDRLAPR